MAQWDRSEITELESEGGLVLKMGVFNLGK